MLTVPNHLLVLNKFGNGFQSYMLHHLLWDRGDTNQPVVVQILLLVLLDSKSDLTFFQSSGISTYHHDLFKLFERGYSMVLSNSSWTSVCPI